MQRYLLLLYTICFGYLTFGQRPNYYSLTVKDGLTQSSVTAMIEDSRGYLWLGTAGGGLCKYNGYSTVSYHEEDGVPGELITSITQDTKGRIWVGSTWGGVAVFNGQEFKRFSRADWLPSDHVTRLCADSSGGVWIGTDDGLVHSDNDNFRKVREAPSHLQGHFISALAASKDHGVLIATETGIFSSDGMVVKPLNSRGNATAICCMSNGSFYFALPDYKYIFHQSGDDLDSIFIPSKARISDLMMDHKGRLWIATLSGIYLFENGQITTIDKQSGLTANDVLCLLEDSSNDIWLGTNSSGALRFPDDGFYTFPDVDGLNNDDIFSVVVDSAATIWVGTGSSGLYSYSREKELIHRDADNGLGGNNIRALACIDHSIFVSTGVGVDIIRNKRIDHVRFPDPYRVFPVRSFYLDSKGRMWYGSYGDGVLVNDGGHWTHYGSEDGLSHDYVYSIIEDKDHSIWLGTGNGINVINGSDISSLGIKQGLCNSYVGTMVKDRFGRIWAGTDKCVAMYDGRSFITFDKTSGLSTNTIYLLQTDKSGNIWVGTNAGVDLLILDADGDVKDIISYGQDDGFTGIECNARASASDAKGDLYFGSINGLIKCDLDKITSNRMNNRIIAPAHLLDISLFYNNTDPFFYCTEQTKWFGLPSSMRLPYDENHLTFSFECIDLMHPEKITYQYKLDGFDQDWTPQIKQRSATYSNIPPGKYTFRVKGCNKNGCGKEDAISFTILRPFWKTWWFLTASVITVLALIYIIFRLRTSRLNRLRRNMRNDLRVQTEEIVRQNEERALLLKEIHHRVKNNLQLISSLLSIQSNYLNNEDASKAFEESQARIATMALIHEKMYQSKALGRINPNEYITSLVRNIINSYSLNQHISEDIQIYVKEMHIDTLIPLGLIINELITNAMKYAFKDQTAGKIVLNLESTADGRFKMLIGDNGVGIDDDIWKTPQSLGLELVHILMDQLEGTIERIKQQGSMFRITFSNVGKGIAAHKDI